MKFDAKGFNPEAFAAYSSRIPRVRENELLKSRAIIKDDAIKNLLSSQTGSAYGTVPMFGRIDGEAVNYDGQTDIDASYISAFIIK